MNSEADIDLKSEARKVLNQHFYGVLSTLSQKYPDYPFGSVVPYCLDRQGHPLILISRLAQHTQNINQHPKVSLVVLDRGEGNVQLDARLTLIADVTPVAKEEIEGCAQRYYRHFPSANGYHSELDFDFYRFDIQSFRFIAGFGQARWLSPSDVLVPNPFSEAEESRIINHMNEDHRDALLHYHQCAPITDKDTLSVNPENIAMAAIDGEGLALRVNDALERIQFPRTVTTALEARQVLVEMASA